MEQPPFGLAFLKQNEKDCNDEKTALNSVDYENLTNDQKTALQNMLKEYLNMQTAYHMLSQDSFKDVFAKGKQRVHNAAADQARKSEFDQLNNVLKKLPPHLRPRPRP